MNRRPPRSPLFPSTTLSRSLQSAEGEKDIRQHGGEPDESPARPAAHDREDEEQEAQAAEHTCESAATGSHEVDRHGQRSEEHTSELQSRQYLVCRLLLEKKN